MRTNAQTFGWLFGYFVVISPIISHFPHKIYWSLLHGIIGLVVAIILLEENK